MSLLRTVTLTYVLGFSGLAIGGLYYTKDIKRLGFNDYPSDFKKYVNPKDFHGMYQKGILKAVDMQVLVERMFKQPLYNLEYGISETEPPEHIKLEQGQKIGNLVIEIVKDNQIIFRYLHKDFNFRLFLQNNSNRVIFGFSDYTGDVFEGLGSHVFIPLLLEGATTEES